MADFLPEIVQAVRLEDTADQCPRHGCRMQRVIVRGTVQDVMCRKCVEQEIADESIEQQVQNAVAIRKRRLAERFNSAGVGEMFSADRATFETFQPQQDSQQAYESQVKALAMMTSYAGLLRTGKLGIPWIRLVGPRGVGKTHLAAALFHALPLKAVLFCKDGICDDVKRLAWFDEKKIGTEAAAAQILKADLVIWDDFGAKLGESKSAADQQALDEIIDQLYRSRRPFVLISNLLGKQIEELVGKRSWDRLDDQRMVRIIPIVGKSYRQKSNGGNGHE
jgi:DNA replication protein DnaC